MVTLLLLLLLFLFLEHLFKLLNGATVLISELLQLGSVLLFLLSLAGALVFVLFTHQLIQKLVSLFRSVIVDLLALFDDFRALSVAHRLADCQWGVASVVALKDVSLRVLDYVLEHLVVACVLRDQVHDVRAGACLLDEVVRFSAEQDSDDLDVGVRRDHGEL